MILRTPQETVQSLRLTLQRLEQSADSSTNPDEVAELKQILLRRIADLEVLGVLESQSSASAVSDRKSEASVDLAPLEIVAAEGPAKESAETVQLDEELDKS
jgi:hypothetical protein